MGDESVRVPRVATLDRFAEATGKMGGIFIKDLPLGIILEIQTQNSIYTLVADPVSEEVLIKGGKYLPELVPCVYFGAVFFGGINTQMNWIKIGMSMNFKRLQDIPPATITTTPVKSIRIVEQGTKTVQ